MGMKGEIVVRAWVPVSDGEAKYMLFMGCAETFPRPERPAL